MPAAVERPVLAGADVHPRKTTGCTQPGALPTQCLRLSQLLAALHLAHVVLAGAVRAQHHIPGADALGHSPQRAAGQARRDPALVGVAVREHRDGGGVELPPLLRQLVAQVLADRRAKSC